MNYRQKQYALWAVVVGSLLILFQNFRWMSPSKIPEALPEIHKTKKIDKNNKSKSSEIDWSIPHQYYQENQGQKHHQHETIQALNSPKDFVEEKRDQMRLYKELRSALQVQKRISAECLGKDCQASADKTNQSPVEVKLDPLGTDSGISYKGFCDADLKMNPYQQQMTLSISKKLTDNVNMQMHFESRDNSSLIKINRDW